MRMIWKLGAGSLQPHNHMGNGKKFVLLYIFSTGKYSIITVETNGLLPSLLLDNLILGKSM